MDTREIHELTAAYALDALGPEDSAAYEAHLAQCERCRAELAMLSESASALAWAVEPAQPPEPLRARVLEAAAAERRSALPQAVRRPWLLRAAVAAAAVATCAAVGLGIWAALLYRSADQERSARTAVASALDILTNPASRRVPLAGRDGVVAVEPSGQAVLVVRRLPPAPAGQTYEAWVIPRGGAPVPAGLFDGGGATTVVRLREAVPSGAVVAATVERAGGAKAPTQTPILHAGI